MLKSQVHLTIYSFSLILYWHAYSHISNFISFINYSSIRAPTNYSLFSRDPNIREWIPEQGRFRISSSTFSNRVKIHSKTSEIQFLSTFRKLLQAYRIIRHISLQRKSLSLRSELGNQLPRISLVLKSFSRGALASDEDRLNWSLPWTTKFYSTECRKNFHGEKLQV